MQDPHPLHALISQLCKLPGVGQKSAQRLAFFFLSLPQPSVQEFSQVLLHTRQHIQYCQTCFNISFQPTCSICLDPNRNTKILCVVAEPKDMFALERTGDFKGIYHILGGVISPLDGIHPQALRIAELIHRLQESLSSEIIFAINPTIEGDATVLYLMHALHAYPAKKTRLAYGLPVGSDLDYADDLTLKKAFSGRTQL